MKNPLSAKSLSKIVAIICLLGSSTAWAQKAAPQVVFQRVVDVLDRTLKKQQIVGAQLVVGNRNSLIINDAFGKLGPNSQQAVDRQNRQ